MIEGNIFTIFAAAASFIAAWVTMKHKVKSLEEKNRATDEKIRAIEGIKMEVQLAEIRTDIAYIRKSIENGKWGGD